MNDQVFDGPKGRCGHPCKGDGRPCRRFITVPYNTCSGHLPDDVKARQTSERTPAEVRPSFEEEYAAIEPACWEWAVSDADLAAARQVDEALADILLKEWQRDRCAVCGEPGCGWLVIDHDHQTGLIRGMLCRSCNTREGGCYGWGPFMKYRKRNPAEILGLRARYWDPIRDEWAKPAAPPDTPEDRRKYNPLIGIGL